MLRTSYSGIAFPVALLFLGPVGSRFNKAVYFRTIIGVIAALSLSILLICLAIPRNLGNDYVLVGVAVITSPNPFLPQARLIFGAIYTVAISLVLLWKRYQIEHK